MDMGSTNQLWNKGPASWNEWAQQMLSRRDKGTTGWSLDASAHFDNRRFANADFTGVLFPGPTYFRSYFFGSKCNYSNAVFHGSADFQESRFACESVFQNTKFLHNAGFIGCKFYRRLLANGLKVGSDASFYGAVFFDGCQFIGAELHHASFGLTKFRRGSIFWDCNFTRLADFTDAVFINSTSFTRVRFCGSALFDKALFKGKADFSAADFSGAASFVGAAFLQLAEFGAIVTTRTFDLAGATFHEVPNFIQATFSEAPRLDNVVIERKRRVREEDDVQRHDVDDDLPARWRALKRLALQGHDHIRELDYFAEELQALKRKEDKGVAACAICLYEHLSDFGRSISRPVLWWLAVVVAFWWLYLVIHLFSAHGHSAAATCTLPQAAGKALELSIHKALPFAGIASPDKLNQIYACLYGVRADSALNERFTPVIPGWVYYPGMIQTLFSLVLIFLFLLALRNHFRIR